MNFDLEETVFHKYLKSAIGEFIEKLERMDKNTKNDRTLDEELDMINILASAKSLKSKYLKG